MKNPTLNTVPNFLFQQTKDGNSIERPIEVLYYKGTVTLKQIDDEYENEVLIDNDKLEEFIRLLRKKFIEAQQFL